MSKLLPIKESNSLTPEDIKKLERAKKIACSKYSDFLNDPNIANNIRLSTIFKTFEIRFFHEKEKVVVFRINREISKIKLTFIIDQINKLKDIWCEVFQRIFGEGVAIEFREEEQK